MKRFLTILILAVSASAALQAQDMPQDTSWITPGATLQDTVRITHEANAHEVISDLPNEFLKLDTMPQPRKYRSRHMLGVRYYYTLTNVSSNPPIGESMVGQALNFGLMYTYYHPMWDHINIFGLQLGANYCHVGYDSKYPQYGEKITEIQLQAGAQFHIDIKQHARVLINAGPFYGYKLSTDKAGGFDSNDIRHDYGIYAGAGFALVFGRFDIHIEGNYQFSLCSLYHTYKYSDLYWLTAMPRNINISATLYYNLW